MKNLFKNVKPSTIVRCVIFIVVLINQTLAVLGKGLPFTNDLVYQVMSIILTIGVGLWATWKNNDFTELAKTVGKIFDALKDGRISKEEAEKLIQEADKIVEEQKNITNDISSKENAITEDVTAVTQE